MDLRDWKIVRGYQKKLLKLTRGRFFDTVRGGRKVLILTTIGRKSGQLRTVILVYFQDGDDFVVCASAQGEKTPAWWLNLQRNAKAILHVKGQKFNVIAREATELEEARLWPKAVKCNSHWQVYRARAKRHLPLIIMRPS